VIRHLASYFCVTEYTEIAAGGHFFTVYRCLSSVGGPKNTKTVSGLLQFEADSDTILAGLTGQLEHEQRMTDENQQQQPRRPFLFDTSTSMRRYVLRMGLISVIPSLAIGIALGVAGLVNEETSPSFEGGPWRV